MSDKPSELTVPERLEVLTALASGMTAELELATLRAENERLRGALEDCGTSRDNPDTCGVCHMHFADCDAERACFVGDDDRPIQPDFPACAGGRARAALSPQRASA